MKWTQVYKSLLNSVKADWVARATERVVRLRGYGDGITAPVAQAFIEAYMTADRRRAQVEPIRKEAR